jgi:hypothetical protein
MYLAKVIPTHLLFVEKRSIIECTCNPPPPKKLIWFTSIICNSHLQAQQQKMPSNSPYCVLRVMCLCVCLCFCLCLWGRLCLCCVTRNSKLDQIMLNYGNFHRQKQFTIYNCSPTWEQMPAFVWKPEFIKCSFATWKSEQFQCKAFAAFTLPVANPTIVIYNASIVNFYNATGSLACFENKNILFYFEKRWNCSCKFKSRKTINLIFCGKFANFA